MMEKIWRCQPGRASACSTAEGQTIAPLRYATYARVRYATLTLQLADGERYTDTAVRAASEERPFLFLQCTRP